MFCDNCGSELRDNAAFCPKCGTAITTETDPVKSTKTHSSLDYRDGYTNHTKDGSTTQAVCFSDENDEQLSKDSNGGKKRIIIVICIILFLAIAIGIVIMLVVNNAKSAPEKNSTSSFILSSETKATEKASEFTQHKSTEPTITPTDPVATAPKKEAETEASFTITQDEIESEIKKIRTYYYTPSSHDVQKVLENGQNGWNYSRDYRFHDDRLVFAFVFDGTEEHRLYFKDDHMIRYIDEHHTTYDYPDTAQFSNWENKVLSEAYTLIESNENNVAKQNELSASLGTWTVSTGENLEIYDVSEGGLMLRFNKLSESGSKISIVYPLEFDDSSKTVASEFENSHDYGWEYTFILDDGYITVKSRYPDQLFYKE